MPRETPKTNLFQARLFAENRLPTENNAALKGGLFRRCGRFRGGPPDRLHPPFLILYLWLKSFSEFRSC